MRNCLFILGFALLSMPILGCGGSSSTGTIDIPEANPYQQTPEEIAEYNAKGAAESKKVKGDR